MLLPRTQACQAWAAACWAITAYCAGAGQFASARGTGLESHHLCALSQVLVKGKMSLKDSVSLGEYDIVSGDQLTLENAATSVRA